MKKDKGSSDRFGYEWKKYNKISLDYEKQFLKWVYPLTQKDFKNKKILDAGCGIGRNSFWPLKYGAEEVVAFDYDTATLNSAKKNLGNFENCKIFHGSIYNIPYENYFDISFSIGVIHHLEKPLEAISSLIKATKKNGIVLIWVYGYENNEFIVKYLNPLRKITSRLPPKITHLITYLFSIPLYFYLKLFNQKRDYFKQISRFKFWHVHSICFDQLLPKIANYWTKSQALELLERFNLKNIKIFPVNNMSWTVIGTK
jgi:SAM-dependent methyltransferase